MSEYVFVKENMLTVMPGSPIRLLPVGRLVKDGKARDLTKELLAKFRLPHFKPPIKLGSHNDTTKAGGHIVGLEVHDDGLYGLVEYTDEGRDAMANGHYRYHSPEVIWEGGFEDPETGDVINGPLIVGTALLHTPHLGESAALYSVEVIDGGESIMTTNQDMVSVGALERLKEFFTQAPQREPQEPKAPEPVIESVQTFEAEYQQAAAERDDLAARVAAMEAEQVRGQRIATYSAELGEQGDGPLFELLAGLPEEQADDLVRRFKALIAQAQASGLTKDVGNNGTRATGSVNERFNAAVEQFMADHNVDRQTAALAVVRQQPEILED